MAKCAWYVCEAEAFRAHKGSFCIYSNQAAVKMIERTGLPRCIKHGALLHYEYHLDGMSRQRAREWLEKKGTGHAEEN